MHDPSSPREVLERLLDGISNQQWHQLADLYAEDAVVDLLFATPVAARLVGREAIRRHFASVARLPVHLRTCNVVVHETGDPEVIIGEYDYDIIRTDVSTSTDASVRVANIVAWRVREGRVVASRDYHNHHAMAAAAGVSRDGPL